MRRIILPLIAFALAEPATADWNQWRGPNRDGSVSGVKWPEKLTGLKEKWRLPLRQSYSGPVTGGKFVFTTESRDKQFELLHAVDTTNGKIAWSGRWEGYQSVPFFAARNGDWIRATPAVDGTSIYVAGMQDILLSFDVNSGKENWRLNFPKELKATGQSFGFVTSPLVEGGFLYTHTGAGFVKVDCKAGQVVWRALNDGGGMMGGSFSSPVFGTVADQRQLLVQGRSQISGIDPESGKVLWEQPVKAFRGMNIYTPVLRENRLFTSAYGGLTQAWDLKKEGPAVKPVLAWEHKAEGYMSTPVIIAGKVYMHLRNQKLCCFDLTTGVQHWVSEQKFGEYMSLVFRGDSILALDQKGILYLIRANPEKLEILDQRKIAEDECWAHLALDGNMLYVRELKALVALEWKAD